MEHFPAALLICTVLLLSLQFDFVRGIRCYQCSSSHDPKGEDNCGAYEKFEKHKHIAVECNSDESNTPGSFCMKLTQQGPKGFIWDGRWRQVIRRCASVSETFVTGVCNWGVYENGVYWEECYCSEDSCNSAERNAISSAFVLLTVLGISISYYICSSLS